MDFEKKFAKAILEAQKIREEYFDQIAFLHDFADEAKGNLYVDFSQFYTKTVFEASEEAACNAGFSLRMIQPIYLLIKYTWNDIQHWANTVIKE